MIADDEPQPPIVPWVLELRRYIGELRLKYGLTPAAHEGAEDEGQAKPGAPVHVASEPKQKKGKPRTA